ncbi:unnamed protein product, partial [Callosobruchus maculatus]
MNEFELLSLLGISVILFTSSVNECHSKIKKFLFFLLLNNNYEILEISIAVFEILYQVIQV